MSFCKEVNLDWRLALAFHLNRASRLNQDTHSGNSHGLLREFVNSIMNFMFMTDVPCSPDDVIKLLTWNEPLDSIVVGHAHVVLWLISIAWMMIGSKCPNCGFFGFVLHSRTPGSAMHASSSPHDSIDIYCVKTTAHACYLDSLMG